MARIEPFEDHSLEYDKWFDENRFAYESELLAIRKQLPETGYGMEIGVGTGRFAAPLGITKGLEPSRSMAELARKKGIDVVDGVAEDLPFPDSEFDFLLMVTTICFVDDLDLSLQEAYRILKDSGVLVIAFVDRESLIGRIYEKFKEDSTFYRMATFYSVDEVVSSLKKPGFQDFSFFQTIFRQLDEINAPEPLREGYGEGSFVVIRAQKQSITTCLVD